jgi:hypothetical protein
MPILNELLNLIGMLISFATFGLAFTAATLADVDPLPALIRALVSAFAIQIIFVLLQRLLVPLLGADKTNPSESQSQASSSEESAKPA